MTPVDWATRPLKKYADFTGRAPRAEYWWFYLGMIVAYLVAMIIDSLVGVSLFGPYGVVTCLLAFLTHLCTRHPQDRIEPVDAANYFGRCLQQPIAPEHVRDLASTPGRVRVANRQHGLLEMLRRTRRAALRPPREVLRAGPTEPLVARLATNGETAA